jgi:hypothetical protein
VPRGPFAIALHECKQKVYAVITMVVSMSNIRRVLLIAMAVAVAFLVAAPIARAGAASTYPPPTTTIPTSHEFTDSTPGNPVQVSTDSSNAYVISGCNPNALATITVNGVVADQQNADATGTLTFTVAWGVGTVSINNGTPVPASLGANNINVSCMGPNGLVSKTAYFNLVSSGGGGGGGLAFTGAEIALLALVAVGLVLGGTVLLVGTARRSSRTKRSRSR